MKQKSSLSCMHYILQMHATSSRRNHLDKRMKVFHTYRSKIFKNKKYYFLKFCPFFPHIVSGSLLWIQHWLVKMAHTDIFLSLIWRHISVWTYIHTHTLWNICRDYRNGCIWLVCVCFVCMERKLWAKIKQRLGEYVKKMWNNCFMSESRWQCFSKQSLLTGIASVKIEDVYLYKIE